jgi:glycosyltransferase involved in cell wall biosynthesis
MDLFRSHDKRVVVFRKDLLPISETFILDQFRAYSEWSPSLIGFRFVPGIDLADIKAEVVQRNKSLGSEVYLKLIQHGQYFGLRSGQLRSMIAKTGAAILHAHFGYDAILVYDVSMELDLPLVVTLHGTDVLTKNERWISGKNGRFFRRYPEKLQKLFRDPRVWFITVSDAIRTAALALGAPPARTRTLYTGVDCARFFPSRKKVKNHVLFVGRLVEFKGCEYLIRAMKKVQNLHPDMRLRVVGEGPLRKELENLARGLDVTAEFLGAVPRPAVIAELADALTLCVPSITDAVGNFEAFGMVILEAQASGIPVISSALGGREGIIHGKTGFVFNERDVVAIENSILELAGDRRLPEEMGIAAREYVCDRFSILNCTKAVEAFYNHVRAAHRRPAT